jgi:short-subunit dehydrogenase
VNALQPIYTAKVLIDQLINREQLSALVVTSSGLGSAPIPGCVDYSCSKSFASYLAEGLNYELKGKVDCMSWQSGKVATKMNGSEADGSHCVTRTVAVNGMFKDLGKESLTYGCLPHAKSMFIIGCLPFSMVQKKFFAGFKQ